MRRNKIASIIICCITLVGCETGPDCAKGIQKGRTTVSTGTRWVDKEGTSEKSDLEFFSILITDLYEEKPEPGRCARISRSSSTTNQKFQVYPLFCKNSGGESVSGWGRAVKTFSPFDYEDSDIIGGFKSKTFSADLMVGAVRVTEDELVELSFKEIKEECELSSSKLAH